MDGLQRGKDERVPPTASPSKNEGELDLHTKPRRVAVTDLSEESASGRAETLPRSGLTP